MGWIMFAFFVFVTFVFIVFAVFFPEWVGITGKKALEIQKDHIDTSVQTTEQNQSDS